MLEPALDVNACLQVEPEAMHDSRAFGFDLHKRHHVKRLTLRVTFHF